MILMHVASSSLHMGLSSQKHSVQNSTERRSHSHSHSPVAAAGCCCCGFGGGCSMGKTDFVPTLKNNVFGRLTLAETEGFRTNFSRSCPTFMSKNYESG